MQEKFFDTVSALSDLGSSLESVIHFLNGRILHSIQFLKTLLNALAVRQSGSRASFKKTPNFVVVTRCGREVPPALFAGSLQCCGIRQQMLQQSFTVFDQL
jgi:hypothetical protein